MLKAIYGFLSGKGSEDTIVSITTDPADTNIFEGDTIQFIGSINGGDPKTYDWVFPGGSPNTSTQQTVNVTFNTEGTYIAELTGTNSTGTGEDSVTIIVEQSGECIEPPNDSEAAIWLSGYDSTDENTAISTYGVNGIAPQGGVMGLSFYKAQRVQDEIDHGCTMIGPIYNASEADYVDICKTNGIKLWYRLRTSDTPLVNFCDIFGGTTCCTALDDDGNLEYNKLATYNNWPGIIYYLQEEGVDCAALQGKVTDKINTVLADTDLNDVVALWYGYADDAWPKDSEYCPSYGWPEITTFFNMSTTRVRTMDTTKKRPILWSANSNPGEATFEDYFLPYAPGIMQQDYYMKDISIYDYSTDDEYKRFLVIYNIRKKLQAAVDVANGTPGDNTTYTGFDTPLVYTTLDAYYDPINVNNRNETHLRKICTFDFWASMVARVSGKHTIDGLNVYTRVTSQRSASNLIQENIYLEQIKLFTDYDFHKAFAWGDLVFDYGITKYDDAYSWQRYGTTQPDEDGIQHKCILYRNRRFFLLVNILNETKEVTLSNLPSEYLKYTDISTGNTTNLESNSLTFNIDPLGFKAFVFELVDCIPNPEDKVIYQTNDGCISFDATYYTLNTPSSSHYWENTSGIIMEALPDTNTTDATRASLSYTINFNRTGTHYVWVHGKALASDPGNSDSVFIQLNTDAVQAVSGFGSTAGSFIWENNLYNVDGVATINVTATGNQTFNIKMREDGFAFDKIEIHPTSTTNPGDCGLSITSGIRIDSENPSYWNINGTRKLLKGGFDNGEPFLTPITQLRTELELLKNCGGNAIRNTMAIYPNTRIHGVYPFLESSDTSGCWLDRDIYTQKCFNLTQINPTYFNYLKTLLLECLARDIVVTIEPWDSWYYANNSWACRNLVRGTSDEYLQQPFRPANCATYTSDETGLLQEYNNVTNTDFAAVAIKAQNGSQITSGEQRLLTAQNLFVSSILDIVLTGNNGGAFPNVLIEISNECPWGTDWNKYWANFIKNRAPNIPIVQQSEQRNITISNNAPVCTEVGTAITFPSYFDFSDISQNEVFLSPDDRYLRAVRYVNWIKGKSNRHPVNNTKTYRYFCDSYYTNNTCGWVSCSSGKSYNDNVGVTRVIYNLLAGCASSTFHPHSGQDASTSVGNGLNDSAVNAIKGISWVENFLDISYLTPYSDFTNASNACSGQQWCYRAAGDAYAMGNDTALVMYFTENTQIGCNFKNNLTGATEVFYRWFNVNDGTVGPTWVLPVGYAQSGYIWFSKPDSIANTAYREQPPESISNIGTRNAVDTKWLCIVINSATLIGDSEIIDPTTDTITIEQWSPLDFEAADEGTEATYNWSFPSSSGITDKTGRLLTNVPFDIVGEFDIELTTIVDGINYNPDTVTVIVDEPFSCTSNITNVTNFTTSTDFGNASSVTITQGDELQITSSLADHYTWRFSIGSGLTDIVDSASDQVILEQFNNTGTFIVRLTENENSVDCAVDSLTVTVESQCQSNIELPSTDSISIHQYDDVTFRATEPSGGGTYLWDFDDSGISDSTDRINIQSFDTQGTFNVTLITTKTDGTECLQDSVEVTVGAPATCSSVITTPATSSISIAKGTTQPFVAQTVTGGSYTWTFSSGSGITQKTGSSISATFDIPGNHTVTLVTRNSDGVQCSADTVAVEVTCGSTINSITNNTTGETLNANGPLTITNGDSLTFVGSWIADASYNWDFGSAGIPDKTTRTTTVTFNDTGGPYTITYTVSYNGYSCSNDTVNITVEDIPVSSDICSETVSSGFLTNYVNPRQASFDENKIYPYGQRMMLSVWNAFNTGLIDDMYEHGFTMVGPHENAWALSETTLERVDSYGMRVFLLAHLGKSDGETQYARGIVWSACEAWKEEVGVLGGDYTQFLSDLVDIMSNRYYGSAYGGSESLYNTLCDAWMSYPEEVGQKCIELPSTCPNVDVVLEITEKVIDKIRELDANTVDRPIFKTDLSTSSYSFFDELYYDTESPFKQNYPAAANTSWSADLYKPFELCQGANYTSIEFMEYIEANGGDIGRPEGRHWGTCYGLASVMKLTDGSIVTATFSDIQKSTPGWFTKFAEFCLWITVAQGCKAITFYTITNTEVATYLWPPFKRAVKVLTDYGFDKAIIWGTETSSQNIVNITKISGPNLTDRYEYPALVYKQWHLGCCRFIVATNGSWTENIVIRLSGWGVSDYNNIVLRNCKTDTTQIINTSTINVTILPQNYVIYKIEPNI
jgi:PKD repeat protein